METQHLDSGKEWQARNQTGREIITDLSSPLQASSEPFKAGRTSRLIPPFGTEDETAVGSARYAFTRRGMSLLHLTNCRQ